MVTAIIMPNQAALVGTGSLIPATGGVMDNTFSVGGWVKINSAPGQYMALVSFLKSSNPGESNSYLWFGYDNTAGTGYGSRGMSYYIPLGGHALTTPWTYGNWYHWCITRNNNIWTGYTNGIRQVWDSTSPADYVDFTTTVDEIDKMTFIAEPDFPGDSQVVTASTFFACRKALSDAEVLTVMNQQVPGTGISGFNATGIWPLTGPTDLSSLVGGPDLTIVNPLGATITSEAGPPALDQPAGGPYLPFAGPLSIRTRGFFV